MAKPLNILPIIAAWRLQFEQGSFALHKHRGSIKEWLKVNKLAHERDIDLAADCLIAAGFGYEEEQESTVYGGYVLD